MTTGENTDMEERTSEEKQRRKRVDTDTRGLLTGRQRRMKEVLSQNPP
jgi:hypothetical protein